MIRLGKIGVGAKLLKHIATARDYIQDGLVAMWDGIENAGWGVHEPNATTWKDLASSYDMSISGFDIGDDFVRFNKTSISFETEAEQGNATIEIVLDNLAFTTYYANIVSVGQSALGTGNPEYAGSLSAKSVYIFNKALYTDSYELYQQNYWHPFVVGTTSISFYSKVGTFNWNNPFTINGNLVYFKRTGGNSTTTESSTFMLGHSNVSMNVKSVRLYSRLLLTEEIAHNYAIDKERFNLP